MIWLDICDDNGNAYYFDIHHVERRREGRRWRHAVNGICGNGRFEVEVLVEPGEQAEVTFVDLSASRSAWGRLLDGIDTARLESGLIDAAVRHCGLKGAPSEYEHVPHAVQRFSLRVNEPGVSWEKVG